jgi:hypothetical protein
MAPNASRERTNPVFPRRVYCIASSWYDFIEYFA